MPLCPNCNGKMKLLLESFYCPNDCDRNPSSKINCERVVERIAESVKQVTCSVEALRTQIRKAARVNGVAFGTTLTTSEQDALYREAELCIKSLNDTQKRQIQAEVENFGKNGIKLTAIVQYEPGLGGWGIGDSIKIDTRGSMTMRGVLNVAWLVDWIGGTCCYSSLSINRIITHFTE